MQFHKFYLTLFCLFTYTCTLCLAAPELISPVDDARFGDEKAIVVLEWEDTGATRYEFELAVDEAFELGTGPLDAEDTPFFNLNDWLTDDVWFSLNISLYWRIRDVSTSGTPGEWSESRLFHKSALGPAQVTRGRDGRYSPDTDLPILKWENSSDETTMESFQLEFATDLEFTSVLGRVDLSDPELDFTGVDRTSWDLLEGVFYWRVAGVMASDVAGYTVPGPWTDICRLSKTLVVSPEVIGPDNGHAYTPTSAPATFSWNSLGTTDQYQIRLYADPAGEIEVLTLPLTGTHTGTTYNFKTDLGIDDETWYYAPFSIYWSVAGEDSQGRPGPFSAPREMIKPGYHRIAGYGDSITEGNMEGNEDDPCYTPSYYTQLDNLLTGVWGQKTSWVNIAVGGMKSKWGADNSAQRLRGACPEYVLVMFGINDIVDPGHCDPPHECHIVDHLAEIGTISVTRGTVPIISTILPVNPDGKFAHLQEFIDEINVEIITMVEQMGFHWVDLNAMFHGFGYLPALYCDWGHPSEAGYDIMAQGYFQAIMNASS